MFSSMWWLVIIVFGLLNAEIPSTVLDSRLSRAMVAQIESSSRGGDPEALSERIQYLEGDIDRLSNDIQGLIEESELSQNLLSERSSQGAHRFPSGERAS